MTDDLTTTERNVVHIVRAALDALPAAHRQRRVDYCHEHDEHGARLFLDPELGTFVIRWGGEDLASGPMAALYGTELPEGELVRWGPVPDDPSSLFEDGEQP